MTRFEAQIRNSSQMGPRPKMKINTVARTKLGVYTCPSLRNVENQEQGKDRRRIFCPGLLKTNSFFFLDFPFLLIFGFSFFLLDFLFFEFFGFLIFLDFGFSFFDLIWFASDANSIGLHHGSPQMLNRTGLDLVSPRMLIAQDLILVHLGC